VSVVLEAFPIVKNIYEDKQQSVWTLLFRLQMV
jgi:uncharacterized pyridoxamine 5'-phosphate oxidase family protein